MNIKRIIALLSWVVMIYGGSTIVLDISARDPDWRIGLAIILSGFLFGYVGFLLTRVKH